jgi:hypothetical protein
MSSARFDSEECEELFVAEVLSPVAAFEPLARSLQDTFRERAGMSVVARRGPSSSGQRTTA